MGPPKQGGWTTLVALLTHAMATTSRWGQTGYTEEQDYCHLQRMNASCSAGHVVLMESARYGRMKVGRCLNTNYHVGCYANVLPFVDSKCSGLPSCSVKVLDSDLVEQQPCRADLMAYLEAKYSCVKVTLSGRACPLQGYVSVTGPVGHILLDVRGVVGSSHCPWLIQLLPGQRVNLTLFDLSVWQRSSRGAGKPNGERISSDHCNYRLRFTESGRERHVALCEDDTRVRHVYTSLGHVVEVHIDDRFSFPEGQKFLLKFEALGCADVHIPPNSWARRDGLTASVTCNDTKETWHVVCRDGVWIGEIGNCSNSVKLTSSRKSTLLSDIQYQFHYGILIAVGLGLVLGILMGTIMLGCMMACRKRKRARRRQACENRSAEGCLLGASPESHYQTAASVRAREEGDGLSSRLPDYGHCCTRTAADHAHLSCETLDSKDDGPDVIYPRRITFYHVDDAENRANAMPTLKTFKGNTYERTAGANANAPVPPPPPPATNNVPNNINTGPPSDVLCCNCDPEEMELRELTRDAGFYSGSSTTNEVL